MATCTTSSDRLSLSQVLVVDRRLLSKVDFFLSMFPWPELLGHVSRSLVRAFENVHPATATASSSTRNAGNEVAAVKKFTEAPAAMLR